mmetsp:Transcript_1982/g.4591  ORF Transcript_1982/g.4591 Transcript_1982/m.4591 type:complete len:518 (-) Transcript_1982:536-2089(-)|eukprot:CAMPEP_0178982586 /NCGR_PEP_ID=MMETSP0795-20121207/581_1 /TAXON_ID=88552 /ORGANISM="Amoebophrya sp., Strain Ameob2" /LENGTH=517 /DNA_ID=CAMNT_0020673253 /DNA_START=47 /DNA_END=1600 /DNA_ORIENTATION=-
MAVTPRQDEYDKLLAACDASCTKLAQASSKIKKKAVVTKLQECFGRLRDLLLKWLQDKSREELRAAFESNDFYRLVRLAAILEANKDFSALVGAPMPPDVRHDQLTKAVASVRAVLEDKGGQLRKQIDNAMEKQQQLLQKQIAAAEEHVAQGGAPMESGLGSYAEGIDISSGEEQVMYDAGPPEGRSSVTADHVEMEMITSQMREMDDMMEIVEQQQAAGKSDPAAPMVLSVKPGDIDVDDHEEQDNSKASAPAAGWTGQKLDPAAVEPPETVPQAFKGSWQKAIATKPEPQQGQTCVTEEEILNTIDKDYREQILKVASLADFTANVEPPNGTLKPGNWLIWMCARVYWNDPTLTDVNFTNIYLPPPDKEVLIIPRFMDGLSGRNNVVEKLSLSNCNFEAKSAGRWDGVFEKNTAVKVLDLSSNPWNAETMVGFAAGFAKIQAIEEIRVNNMNFGNGGHSVSVEKTMAEAMEKNQSILKLGLELKDPTWRNKIDRRIMANKDLARQKRVAAAKAGK